MTSGRVTLLALVVLCAISLPWLVHPYFDAHWDATLYILTTRSLLAGEGYAVFGEAFHLRPPGFSLMLAPILSTFGVANFHAMNLFVAAWGIVALALMFVYFRPRLGNLLTLAFCVCVWLNPQYQKICTSVLSDTVGLALLLGCLLVNRWVRARSGAWRYAVLGTAIGLSLYVRSVCVLLIPAVFFSRLLDRDPDRARPGWRRRLGHLALLAGIPVLLQLPWSIWKASHPAPVPSDEVGLHSYWNAQWYVEHWNPDSPRVKLIYLLDRIPLRSEQCMKGFGDRLPSFTLPMLDRASVIEVRRDAASPLALWLGVLGTAALVVVAVRRRDSGSLFAVGNLALLLIYFDYDERILLPSYLFVLASSLELLRGWIGGRWSKRGASIVLAVAVAALTWFDREGPRRTETLKAQHGWYVRAAQHVKDRYPQACVAASLGHVFAPYLHRPVHFLELAASRDKQDGVIRALREHSIDVVIHTGRNNRSLSFWLEPVLEDHGRFVREVRRIRVFEIDKDTLNQ